MALSLAFSECMRAVTGSTALRAEAVRETRGVREQKEASDAADSRLEIGAFERT